MGSASEGVLSHRDHHPAQEADALEPKWHGIGRRQPKPLTGMHCHRNPVENTALRMRRMGTGNGVTCDVLSRLTGVGANLMASQVGSHKKPKPRVTPGIC
jgi:hypothetical protein